MPKAFLVGAAGPRAQLAESNISNGSSNVKRKHRIFRKVPEFSENFQYFQNFSKIFQEIAKIVDIVNDMNAALAREVKQHRFIYLICYTKGFARKLRSLDHYFLCHLYDRSPNSRPL